MMLLMIYMMLLIILGTMCVSIWKKLLIRMIHMVLDRVWTTRSLLIPSIPTLMQTWVYFKTLN